MGMLKTRREAIASIKMREKTVRGKKYVTFDSYVGMDPVTRQPRRFWDTDRKRLEAKISDFYAALKANGAAASILSFQQAVDAKSAYDLAAENGLAMTLREIVEAYVSGRVAEAKPDEAASSITVEAAFAEYIGTFSDIQDRQIGTVNRTVGRWVKSLPKGTCFSSVTHDTIMSYLDSHRNWAPKTWNNAMLYTKTFLEWCASPLRRYAGENALALARKKVIAWKEPEYMRHEDVERLARILESERASRPDCIVFFALWFFCGMRVAEIERMAEDREAVRISIEDETVRVAKPKGYQKGIRPRSFHIEPCALAWLKSVDIGEGLAMLSTKTRRHISEAAFAKGVQIPDNAGRHTFITYHVAAFGDPSRTEGIVGTSANMRCKNYMGLEAKRNGEAYFSVMPR